MRVVVKRLQVGVFPHVGEIFVTERDGTLQGLQGFGLLAEQGKAASEIIKDKRVFLA